MELNFISILLLILVGAGAAFVQRVSGFGSGIFSMLFLPYLFGDTVTAAAVSGLWSCSTTVYNAIRYRKHIRFSLILPIIIPALILLTVSIRLSTGLSSGSMMKILGVVLILLSIYFLFFSKKLHIRPSVPGGIGIGVVGGTLSGLFSTGGPPVVLYLSSILEKKIVYFATIQGYFAITDLYGVVNRLFNRIITWQVLLFALIGLIGSLAGNLLGTVVFHKLDAGLMKRIIYIGMILSGLVMLFK